MSSAITLPSSAPTLRQEGCPERLALSEKTIKPTPPSAEPMLSVSQSFVPPPTQAGSSIDANVITRDIYSQIANVIAHLEIHQTFGRDHKAFPDDPCGVPTQDEVIDRYLDRVIADNVDLAIPGLPMSGRRAPLRLESIYLTLRASYTNRPGGTVRASQGDHSGTTPLWHQDGLTTGEAQTSFSLQEAFRKERRLVVLGDPGSGKTTALQWLAYRLAMEYRTSGPRELGPPRIPIFMRASVYLKAWLERRPTLSAFVGHHLPGYSDGAALNAALKKVLEDGRAVLLLDGLDEVADLKDRYDIAREVDRFLDERLMVAEGNRAVITSRIVGYSVAELKTDAVLMTIEPLAPASVDELCRKLMEALRGGDSDAAAKMSAAVARLREKGYADLVSTPLLVTILALVYNERGGELPTRRLALYALAIDVLVDRWSERARERGEVDFSKQEIWTLFASLAAEMLDRSVVRVSEEDLNQFLERRTNGRRSMAWLKELMRDDVGLLTAQGEGWYGFLHATFQEYLGCWLLMGEPAVAVERIWQKAGKPRWALAVVMAAGMSGEWRDPEARRAFMDELLAHDAGKDAILPAASLLFTAAIPEMDSLPPGVERVAEELVRAHARTVSLRRPAAFAAVIEDGVRLLVRYAGKRIVADVFLRAMRNASRDAAPATAIAVARLIVAAQCETETLAASLLATLPLDSEAWGWPIDAALRDIADRSPDLLPRDRNSLRAGLIADDALAKVFMNDPAWRCLGLMLYGGQDNGLAIRISEALAEEDRLRAALAELDRAPASEAREQEARDERRKILHAELDAAGAHVRAVRDGKPAYSVRHFHRESAALTPLILRALNEGRDAMSLRKDLEKLARDAADESVRVDARIALLALGAKTPVDPATRAVLRRLAPYVAVSMPGALQRATEALRASTIAPGWVADLVSVLADLSHAFGTHLGLFDLPKDQPDGLIMRWLAEALRLVVNPSRPNALYNMAVVLDTAGRVMTSPLMRLVLALSMGQLSMTARWGAHTQWSVDRLAPWPVSMRECLAFALDALEAIPVEFDWVRAWAIECMAPLLHEHGLGEEALIQLHILTSNQFKARADAVAKLAAARGEDPRKTDLRNWGARIEDPWLRFRFHMLLLRSAPELRQLVPGGILGKEASAIKNATHRCLAFEALDAVEYPGGNWLADARAAAHRIKDAENQALAYARLARISRGGLRKLLPRAWSVAMGCDPALRRSILGGIREIATAEERRALSMKGLHPSEHAVVEEDRRAMLAAHATLFEEAKVDTALLLVAATLTDAGATPGAAADADEWWMRMISNGNALPIRYGQLSSAAADAISSLIEQQRNDLAARLLVIAERPNAVVERQLRFWLRSPDDRIRRHAALLLIESGVYSAAAMEGTVELLESRDDRTRFRAAFAIHGNTYDTPPRITTDQTGAAMLELIAATIHKQRGFKPGMPLHLLWFFQRIEYSNAELFVRWVEAAQRSGREGAVARCLIEEMQAVREPVWSAFVGALSGMNGRTSREANRSLIRGLANLVSRNAVTDAMWNAGWPAIAAIDAALLESDPFLLNAAATVVDIVQALADEPAENVARRAEEERAARLQEMAAEIRRLAADSTALRFRLSEIGALRQVNDRFRRAVTAAGERVVLQPMLLEPLVRWLASVVNQPDKSFYETGISDLLCVTASAAERLPDVFCEIAATMPELGNQLARTAQFYPSFPAREAAFRLMALTRHMSLDTVAAFHTVMQDVHYVQQSALETLDRYRSIDQSALEELIASLRNESVTFAYSCAQLLDTLARNSKLDARIRERVIAAFTEVIDDPLSDRDVYVWNQKQHDDKALTIEWRGPFRNHLGRWLGELSGVADLVRAALGGAG